jgi:hypothetical protein
MDYGLGALQSPPDARDFQITDLLAAAPPVALPPSFRVASPATRRCVWPSPRRA